MASARNLAKRIQSRAEKGLRFDADTPGKDRLSGCQEFYKAEREWVKEQHRAGASGLEVVSGLTAIVDCLVKTLSEPAFLSYKQTANGNTVALSLVAIGGYGRSELCPLSDVDLMFLYPSNTSPKSLETAQEHLVQKILYILWDTGLKVGYSTRTVDDAFTEARKDIQTKTALLESRLVYGSHSLYEGFENSYNLFYRKEDPKGYIQQRLRDQRDRRNRYGDTVFMQEPDIKNGVGGLRDYHNTLWMARVRLNVSDVDGLGEQNYLRKNELTEFKAAYDFLLRTRNELHFRSTRPTDLLSLEMQPKVAYRLGYQDRNLLTRVEKFMRDYYRHAENINRISKTVESRLSIISQPGAGLNPIKSIKSLLLARRTERVREIDGFVIRGKEIGYIDENVFTEDPNRLIRVFRHTQQHKLALDLDLSSLIRASAELIDDQVRKSSDANLSFRTILQESGNVYPTLKLMHSHGIIGKFVPEWDRLTCLVQHEYYHRYTADVHTLNTILELDNIFSNSDPIYERYRNEIHKLRLPNLLYLILFLHDIGKGQSIKGHAEIGLEMADPILERMQVSEENRELVLYIIKNHLEMARFWQKYDIDDPDTARVFADQTGTAEKLRLLFIHTFCDARGTAKGLWNQYKEALHSTLFSRTMAEMKAEGRIEDRYQRKRQSLLSSLLETGIRGIAKEEISAHFEMLPDRYFIHNSRDDVVLHIEMINRLFRELAQTESADSLTPVIDWKEDINRSLIAVNVVTWDRAGLFHKLAGSLNVAGYSILSARATSRDDNIAIDTFYVTASDDKSRTVGDATMIFEECVKDALIAGSDLYPVLQNIIRESSQDLFAESNNPLLESFQPQVKAYVDEALDRTILEIQAPDTLGLLYSIAKRVFEHGFDIKFARINTEKDIAIDTLYIEPADPTDQASDDRLQSLQEAISEAVAREQETVVD